MNSTPLLPRVHKKNQSLAKLVLLANSVDFDTRDGCTLSGAGMGALHPLYEILHFTTASVTSVKTSSPF